MAILTHAPVMVDITVNAQGKRLRIDLDPPSAKLLERPQSGKGVHFQWTKTETASSTPQVTRHRREHPHIIIRQWCCMYRHGHQSSHDTGILLSVVERAA